MSARVFLKLSTLEGIPTEFRIFREGVNPTTKGDVVFDDVAAKNVMSAFALQGVDGMIDLEHDAANKKARVARNDAADAMGWYRLEMRGGELWAADVKWSAEGERRLEQKLQRYISPLVALDEDSRAMELLNVALCGMPATLDAQPLIAASRTSTGGSMDSKLMRQALAALKKKDGKAALAMIEQMIVGEDETPEEPGKEAPDETPEMSDAPPQVSAAASLEKELLQELKAFAASLDAKDTEVAALRNELGELQARRASEDLAERRALVGRLVELERELPATAYVGDPKEGKLAKRLADEPLDDLRKRVEAFSAVAPASKGHTPPAGGGGNGGLTDAEVAHMATLKTPEAQARFKTVRLSHRKG